MSEDDEMKDLAIKIALSQLASILEFIFDLRKELESSDNEKIINSLLQTRGLYDFLNEEGGLKMLCQRMITIIDEHQEHFKTLN